MKTPNYINGLKLFAHKYKKNHIYQKIIYIKKSENVKKHDSGSDDPFWVLDIYKCPFRESGLPPFSEKT